MLAAALAVALGTVHPDSAQAACTDAGAGVGTITQAREEAAIRCLLNGERTRRGLRALHAERHLTNAARGHSNAMVRQHFFDHAGKDGSTVSSRCRAAGYHWAALGETIAWGSGGFGTAQGLVRSWMHSPPHRAIILTATYRDIGVGVRFGSPQPGIGGAATATADFGRAQGA